MSSTIGSIGSYISSITNVQRQRQDSDKLAEDLFSQIDSSSKGYISESDLASAFSKISGTSGSSSADELFSSLDSDGDGKVTQDEFSTGLQSLMNTLESQFQSSRMDQAMGSMPPPPPPPENDSGFTKEELQSQLDEIGSTDSARSTLISDVIDNFDAADTDGDGKVTFKEAMALEQSLNSSSSTSTADSASSSTQSSEAVLMAQIMKLAEAYGLFGNMQGSSTVSEVA